MAIYLDENQRSYLKRLLEKNPSTWWAHDKILKQLEAEEEDLKAQENCEHKIGEFKGIKHQCLKCQQPKDFIWERV